METDELRYPFDIAQFFIPEFISRLRRNKDVTEKPSPRQGIAMTSLLLPAYLRKGFLSFGDLVRVAVSTSNVENQNLAERLAYEILLEAESKEDSGMEGEEYLSLLSQKSDDLITYIPTDPEKQGEGEPQAIHDSNVLGWGPGRTNCSRWR
jgi:hypothetical protein